MNSETASCDAEYDYDEREGENLGFALCDPPAGHEGQHHDFWRQKRWPVSATPPPPDPPQEGQ